MTEMYATKLAKAHAEMDEAGIWSANYNPPAYRFLRSIGVEIRPPHYQNFFTQALIMGLIFGPIYGAIVAFLDGPHILGTFGILKTVVISGAAFGFAMAAMDFVRRWQTSLSNWDDL